MPSRSTKIAVLLVVDVVFFFIELISGYAVGSLALVADSFHMLNDVMSLIVALYAIKLSKSEASPQYSYGWHRAEIVAALINGVFLLALCFSICMEAIERFFNPPEISNAKLVVIVGSLGLASNFLGLFLFHEHSHSHDRSAKASDRETVDSSTGPLLPVTENDAVQTTPTQPEEVRRGRADSFSSLGGHPVAIRAAVVQQAQDIGYGRSMSPTAPFKIKSPANINYESRSSSPPILDQVRKDVGERDESDRHPGDVLINIDEGSGSNVQNDYNGQPPQDVVGSDYQDHRLETSQDSHEQHKARTNAGNGHAHGSMNMHALILHVIGDALGNVGVISTGLVIWLSTWRYKYYFDPLISLVITVIIFSSALPLVRSASFILLQAAPSTVSLEELREDIKRVQGVLSVHELHVWQLSENKIVASVHVWVSRKREYMRIARDIRSIMHDHGVHSSTIQPEFYNAQDAPVAEHLLTDQERVCLIPCPPGQDCQPENACCPPPKPPSPPLVDV